LDGSPSIKTGNRGRASIKNESVVSEVGSVLVVASAGQDSLEGPDGAGKSRGEAMPTELDAPTQKPRPFVGFEVETATYARLKPDLLSRSPGQFVAIVGDEVEGPFETFREALRSGYRRFGLGPLYIKQVLPVEPVVEVTRDIIPCRS
jgi:hypothetical protein